jgi:nitrite reductase/ring-hydroxylating ferredoxin subunit
MTDDSRACDACTDDRRHFLATALGAVIAAAFVPAEDALAHVVRATGRRASDGTVRYPVPAAPGATIDADNEVILVRQGASVMAFALSCPHQRAMLRTQANGDTAFRCPKHKSEYRLDGTFVRGRATRHMDRRPITREATEVVVDIDRTIRSDQDAAGWTAAAVSV